jgi:hypothetical protein
MVLPVFAYLAFLKCGHDNLLPSIFFRKEIGACPQVYYITDSESGGISTRIPSIKGAVLIFVLSRKGTPCAAHVAGQRK